MKYLFSFSLLFFLIVSCNEKEKKIKGQQEVIIENFESNEIDISNYAEPSFLLLNTGSKDFIGRIKDLCIVDEKIYILDEVTSAIFLFDLKTGNLIKKINKKGQGPNEYISPIALSADKDNLYVLDMQKMAIIQFDLSLNPISSIKTPKSFFRDFCVVPKGFLLSNESVLKDSQNVIYIDKKGKEVKGFIPYSEKLNSRGKYTWGRLGNMFSNQISSSKKLAFSLNYDGKIYFLDNQMNVSAIIRNDYKEYSLPESMRINDWNLSKGGYVFSVESFLLQKDLLVYSFIRSNKKYYYFYDLTTQKFQTGKVVNKVYKGLPFFPRWVHKNNLIGAMSLHDFKELEDSKLYDSLKNKNTSADDESLVLVFYNFK